MMNIQIADPDLRTCFGVRCHGGYAACLIGGQGLAG